MATTKEIQSRNKRIRVSWFDDLIAWIRNSPNGFVDGNVVELDQNNTRRTLRVTRDVPSGHLLFRIPVVTNGTTDAQLAWYLATRPASILPYLASLPSQIALPRDNEQLDGLLIGSPVFAHLQQSRRHLRNEYDALCKQEENSETEIIWKDFLYYYNAVVSRAFEGPAMVPFLDLCNHSRGNGGDKKNTSYTMEIDTHGTYAVVRAASDIAAATTLTITYGAQANSQLYVNYGFCVEENSEPDGSSNDILEWADGVVWRRGPRSYTYGPLVKAMELVMDDVGSSHESAASLVEDDGMDEFLDECEEDDDESVDCYSEHPDSDPNMMSETSQEDEVRAIRRLHQQVLDRASEYSLRGDKLLKSHQSTTPEEKYAAVLVTSELSILQFYIDAIYKIEKLLTSKPKLEPVVLVLLRHGQLSLIDEQTTDLSLAYMQIRHPTLQNSS